MTKLLSERIRDLHLRPDAPYPSEIDNARVAIKLWRESHKLEPVVDLTKCPRCGGPADNGFDRCLPPTPYWCSRCSQEAAEPEIERYRR